MAVAYEVDGKRLEHVPFELDSHIKPVLRTFSSWPAGVEAARKPSDLPAELLKYVLWLEAELKVPITLMSVGPDREQILELHALNL